MDAGEPTVSVIVPTRDRLQSVRRTIDALVAQNTARVWELIVVDDGSDPPVDAGILADVSCAKLLRGEGRGPASARNIGLSAARGDVVLFTDDDTEPDPLWLEAAAVHLDAHPQELGVEGVIRSSPWDPLYARSAQQSQGGGLVTSNIGFRREVLTNLGGFSEDYRFKCEDLDLAFRVLRHGPIGFAPEMAIVHHPLPLTVWRWIRRGRMVESEIVLFERHRERFGHTAHLPAPLFPLAAAVPVWRTMLREGRRGPLRRAIRAGVIAIGYTAMCAWVGLRAFATAAGERLSFGRPFRRPAH